MLVARPAAKINLNLEVLGRRPDGYHALRSTIVRIGLSDRLSVVAAAPGTTSDLLKVTGLPGAPVEGNLVLRAVASLRAHVGLDLPALEFELDKRIPAGAGLGGGSSDAAAALALAHAAWGIAVTRAEVAALAASIGSDVPFFVADVGAALVEGRGEQVTPIRPPVTALLLLTPGLRLSTADVFARFDELGTPQGDEPNQLWPAAASLAPMLTGLRDELANRTGRQWQLSGSGATLFAIYPSSQAAAEAGIALAADQPSEIGDAHIGAVDLVGPDPVWRYP